MKTRVSNNYNGEFEVKVYNTEMPNSVASFAMELIEKHANVAGIQDGEDSTGRSKLRVQTPEELVSRSFQIAQLTFQAARRLGLMVELPDLNEINAEIDAKSKERQKKMAEVEKARSTS